MLEFRLCRFYLMKIVSIGPRGRAMPDRQNSGAFIVAFIVAVLVGAYELILTPFHTGFIIFSSLQHNA